MKTIVTVKKEVEITTLWVFAEVRYWEDSTINGVDDDEGDLTPFRDGDMWCPIINVDSGIIRDWPVGTTASIHFKICDSGSYFLKDDTGETVLSIERDYVPSILCPNDNGYGDYIILNINENGQIQNWEIDISSFQDKN